MSTLSTETYQEKLYKDTLKSKRIKETKEQALQASKQTTAAYKEYNTLLNTQSQKEEALAKYRNLLLEQEELTKIKSDMLIAKDQAKIVQEQSLLLTMQRQEEESRKTSEFNLNTKHRVKNAALVLENERQVQQQYYEDIHQLEAKRRTKEEQKEKAKVITQQYKANEAQREAEAAMIENNPLNVLYRVTTPYHNNGNSIDYTTTRFHHILVERHDDDIGKLLYANANAYEKAKEEAQKAQVRVKSKEKAVQQFNAKTNENFKEIIRKNKAKENLEAFMENMEKITWIRNKNLNKNRKVNPNANVANAKEMEKRAEYMLKRKLEQQKGNRNNILNGNEGNTKDKHHCENDDVADDESIRNFYKDNDDGDDNEGQCDDYLANAINEHNAEIDNKKYQYEEPIARDPQPIKEQIGKVNAVDLESYQKAELSDDMVIFHKEPIVSNKRHKHLQSALMNEIESEVTEAKFSVLEALKISKKVIDNEEKERLKKKDMNKAVKDFYAKINSSAKVSNKNTLSHIEEEKKEDEGDIGKKGKYDLSKETISSINKDEESARSYNKEKEREKLKKGKEVMIIPVKSITKDKGKVREELLVKAQVPVNVPVQAQEGEGEEQQKEDDYKRDETKWKYSKKELYERKKQLLKDKSNLKKK